eukprot:CAMPEP_0197034674 /NCGR_PEP_ID=MMETSP1384-20130603/12707_1 /TAXON_ID=29189 /ORGANISM="Ammonia sp." /LENGTH=37 /DNA_ID= /DNA_START= /DNA_END= /DNA_ORIENTATION=
MREAINKDKRISLKWKAARQTYMGNAAKLNAFENQAY